MTPTPLNRSLGDIAIVLGTRPEIIKLAGIIRELGPRARVIHTGQHWDDGMAGQFFRDLGIGQPDRTLTSVSGAVRGVQIGSGVTELTEHFRQHPVAAVIVQGDTNSTSIGAQAGNYLGVPVVHVEAGLRSFDRGMPEEINRLVVGALADLHCAATPENAENLRRENVDAHRVVITGNTVVEATELARQQGAHEAAHLIGAETVASGYILTTIHRPENTDTAPALERILATLAQSELPVVFTLHPRTENAIQQFGLERYLDLPHVTVLRGTGHADFLALAAEATLLVSDSGGVQEEVTVLKKPLLVVRRSTERPESIRAGFARLITPELELAEAIHEALADKEAAARLRDTPSPYGDGQASKKIAEAARVLAAR
ncbi:non-hydrolyzing UDP-N-acetylglucosamine 2-epimerase [Mycetocola sp. JXN-3]|uniref:non-hydrolyzing UDP-N-acetylglucosamine 2-epimerase n=1 Tax=Mycetocola sp. JXN-3 TaxID=2116510 RepID=UPI00165D1DF6|nr:UDP-N-acetylglucosamine 2-epimerase (non-hydrolyzing) [Mycetocola sp. JXN-3]